MEGYEQLTEAMYQYEHPTHRSVESVEKANLLEELGQSNSF